ncbi:hypothetical protein ACTHOQ_15185, partial [Solibacillus silvestris]|uniref:hypothetical protein n=1 Tax=Solibacillus silvestris TaxID=76853 RepID=UPI003F7F1FE1
YVPDLAMPLEKVEQTGVKVENTGAKVESLAWKVELLIEKVEHFPEKVELCPQLSHSTRESGINRSTSKNPA